jgi:hypothetical protein
MARHSILPAHSLSGGITKQPKGKKKMVPEDPPFLFGYFDDYFREKAGQEKSSEYEMMRTERSPSQGEALVHGHVTPQSLMFLL